jgi:hypothetical protein
VQISVTANVRGKRYEISDVETVEELCQQVEKQSGLSADEQSVIFRGKVC